jgi:hypothetical protein
MLLLAVVGLQDGLDPDDIVWLAVAIVAITGAAAGLHRWVWRPVKRLWQRMCAMAARLDRALDLIVGYPEVRDPVTDEVLKPATPPMASRVDALESSHVEMAKALVVLADVAERQQAHETWQVEHVADVEQVHEAMWAAIRGESPA